MGCNSCEYLKEKDKKESNGKSVYMCSKTKKYVNGASNACENYKEDIMRKTFDRNDIYRSGNGKSQSDSSVGGYLLLLIVLVILGLILGVFNF